MREQAVTPAPSAAPFPRLDPSTSATYLQALIGNSPIAIIALDALHRVTASNPAFEKLFQYTADDLLAADLDSLIALPGHEAETARLSRLVLEGNHVHAVTQRRRRDGSLVDVEVHGIPLLLHGQLSGVYGLYQDLTEQTRARSAVRAISDQMERLQQEERRQIARDLHDSTAQELTVLNWNLNRLHTLVEHGDESLKQLVGQTRRIALECSARIRSASFLLHPPLLGHGGLTQALPWLVEGFEQRSGIRVLLDLSTDLGRFPDAVELVLFRVVQEALTNALRHSGASSVRIALRHDRGSLALEVSDDGSTLGRALRIDTEITRGSVGVAGMRERVEGLGGSLSIHCIPTGTVVMATLPIELTAHA